MTRTRTLDALLVTAVVGAVLVALAVDPSFDPGWPHALVAVAQGLPLWWRRRRPVATLVATAAAVGLAATLGDGVPLALGPLVATYAVGAWVQGLLAVAVTGVAAAVTGASGSGFTIYAGPARPDLPRTILATLVLHALALLLGRGARARREASERRTAQAVADERVRIARELHDVVAHHVGAMVIQAGAARRVVDRDPARAAEALEAIERAGREALQAMPALLGALRGQDPTELGTAPVASAAGLGELVEQAAVPPLRTRLHVEGDARALPPGVDTSVYRIVQEALTNAAKHAGPATVHVRLRYLADRVEVTVEDDGHGPTENGRSQGLGLVGMAERVALLHGTLHTGARDGGGFVVRATLPTGRGA